MEGNLAYTGRDHPGSEGLRAGVGRGAQDDCLWGRAMRGKSRVGAVL